MWRKEIEETPNIPILEAQWAEKAGKGRLRGRKSQNSWDSQIIKRQGALHWKLWLKVKRSKMALAKKNIVSIRIQPKSLLSLSLLTHSELLLQGFSYLRRLPRQVCADTQVHRCICTCQWGSCIPFAFQHSHASTLHTHPGLERMCNHKFVREGALISCLLHIKQY